MKEFYVMNLDMRRIALLAGGALVALGITLFIGMSIGRGQGEKSNKLSSESDVAKVQEAQSESADRLVLASGPTATAERHADENRSGVPLVPEVRDVPPVPETKSAIPLQEDPLVAGPPKTHKKNAQKKASAKKHESTENKKLAQHKKKKHAVLADDADDTLAPVAGTAKAARVAQTRYTIQVAAFKRSSEASALVEKLKDEGIRARSEKSGNFYLVTVGRSKSKSKLDRALAKLKELDYNVYIRKLSPPTNAT